MYMYLSFSSQKLSLVSYKYDLLNNKGCESPQLQLIWSSENKDSPPITQVILVHLLNLFIYFIFVVN